MSASGRLDPAYLPYMTQVVTVHEAIDTNAGTDLYGQPQTETASRQVNCYIAPTVDAEQQVSMRAVTPKTTIYCDDIDINPGDKVVLPDGTSNPIDHVDTYYDAVGPLYQVVMV